MKIFFISILFSIFFNKTISVVPTWNFDLSSKDLLQNKNYEEYGVKSGNFYGTNEQGFYTLYKKIYKENGFIKQINTINIDNNNFTVDYEDVESAYRNDKYVFICPKGKFHVQKYDLNEKKVYNLTRDNDNLRDKEYWDLKCFYQPIEKMLFIGYLNSKNDFYSFYLNDNTFKVNMQIENGIYSFKWKIYSEAGYQQNEKQMFAIIKNGNYFELRDIKITVIENQGYSWNSQGKKNLVELKSKYYSFASIYNTYFYFINYNNELDFESGYLIEDLSYVDENTNFIINSNKSPFEFLDNITLKETKFIYDSKYVYYKVYSNNKKIYYHGVYDVVLNKIIFNTDKEILDFKPYSIDYKSIGMLAITKESAYKICFYNNDNNDCLEQCNGNTIYNSETNNHCGNECETNFILKPNDICVNTCDESIYIIKNNKECWLCKDLENENKYKLINYSKCLDKMPDNSYFINEQLYLVECNKDTKYNSETNQCIQDKCNENCDRCKEYSENNEDQKCISCQNKEFFLEEGNCIEKCHKGYFAVEKECKKCDDECDSCYLFSNNCTSCIKGKYLDEKEDIHSCKKCSKNCETCLKGEENGYDNCKTCNLNSDFKYLFNTSCLTDCPDNMTQKDYICYDKEDSENKVDDNKTSKKDKIMLSIFIILIGIFLLIIIISFYKKYCCNSKKFDQKNLMNAILLN